MAQNIVKFLVRRGSDSDRKLTVLQQGELGYTTDIESQRLFIGDGITYGGSPVASKFYLVASWTSDISTLGYVQLSDMLFVRSTASLYALTSRNLNITPTSADFIKIGQI